MSKSVENNFDTFGLFFGVAPLHWPLLRSADSIAFRNRGDFGGKKFWGPKGRCESCFPESENLYRNRREMKNDVTLGNEKCARTLQKPFLGGVSLGRAPHVGDAPEQFASRHV